MKRIREAVQTVIRLIRGGAFAGHHRKVRTTQYDQHTLAAWDAEDRADIYSSARADQMKEVAHWGDKSWK